MFELSIEPEDAFKVYSPGESVKGHIVLTVLKGFDITHLVVGLHGYARVYRNQVTPGEGHPLAEAIVNGKGSRGFEYHGSGLLSLFQEEQVLCGSGFLKKQVYKFAFELKFPERSLPSTIEFERGTVSYMISATLTRPVTMMPTLTKHKRVKFQDTIDIEAMNTPKSRIISLEPMNKRGKVKRVAGAPSVGTNGTSSRSVLSRKDTQSSLLTTRTPENPPLSPAPSDDTNATSSSTQSFRQVEETGPPKRPSLESSDRRSSTTSSSNATQTITATTELPRHGALPGDSIPVRVSVAHTKPYVKGVVIATLYRLGRIDMHPNLSTANKKDKKKEDEVYPKSKTGLGGLYFTNSTPNSVFRKDLSQSSTMMVIHPTTLSCDITTSVKVPDSAFPTIANVPGGMISFTYHVEVVIDLFGKLGEARYLPRLTSTDPTFTTSQGSANQLSSEWSNNILDTSQLRRNKSVVTFEMSVTIGTTDSSRKRKQRASSEPTSEAPSAGAEYYDPYWDFNNYREGYDWYYDEHGKRQWYDYGYYSGYPGYENYDEGYWDDQYQEYPTPPPDLIPPPEPQEHVDEKTRLRRHEELLLPSQPPQEGESSSRAIATAPSAPTFDENGEPVATDGIAAPTTPGPPASVVSTRSVDTVRARSGTPPPSIDGGSLNVTDDKQELERRRLMAQASAPPDDNVEASSSSAPSLEPSAPDFSEHDLHFSTIDDEHHDLPTYQR